MAEEITFEQQQEACRLIKLSGGEVQYIGKGLFKVTLPQHMKVIPGTQEQACEYLMAGKLVERARELYGKQVAKSQRKPRSDKGVPKATKKKSSKKASRKPAKKSRK